MLLVQALVAGFPFASTAGLSRKSVHLRSQVAFGIGLIASDFIELRLQIIVEISGFRKLALEARL